MKILRALPILLLPWCAALAASVGPPATGPAAERFELRVKFNDTLELAAEITVDQPFVTKVKDPQGGFVAISGVLLPPVGGKYPCALTTFNWQSETSNGIQSTKPELVPGTPVSWGVINGPPRFFTVTLSRAK